MTKHGKPAVVVVAADEYERLRKLQQLKAPTFAEMLLAMPQGDIELERRNTIGWTFNRRASDRARD